MIIQEVLGQVSAMIWSDLKNRLHLAVQNPYEQLCVCWKFHVLQCIFAT